MFQFKGASCSLRSVNLPKENTRSTRRSNTLVCFFVFASCVGSIHLPSVALLWRISCTRFQEKLCFTVPPCNADCTTVPLEEFTPSVLRTDGTPQSTAVTLCGMEQVYTQGRLSQTLWLQILNAMQAESHRLRGLGSVLIYS